MNSPHPDSDTRAIIFFDGICVLCNTLVQFIIKQDHGTHFRFASLQSDFAKLNIPAHPLDQQTIVLWNEEQIKIRSEAIFDIANKLKYPWKMIWWFRWLPRWLSDAVYNVIARYRYKIFGKHTHCPLPDASTKDLFIP